MTLALYPDYESEEYTPNSATWLFVLIRRFREEGHSLETAIAMAMAKIKEQSPIRT